MPHCGETDGVQLVVFGDLVLDLLFERPPSFGWQGNERPGCVDKLAIEIAVVVPRDAAA